MLIIRGEKGGTEAPEGNRGERGKRQVAEGLVMKEGKKKRVDAMEIECQHSWWWKTILSNGKEGLLLLL